MKKLPQVGSEKQKLARRSSLLHLFAYQLLRLFVCLVLFAGGIIILALRIPGWSLILGLPATQIGLIFLIFNFDELARKRFGPESFHLLYCSRCGKPTLAPPWQEKKICHQCQQEVIKKFKEKREKIRTS